MAAPTGNQFALGNMGKPKTFESPEELQEYIDDYFDKCDERVIIQTENKSITEPYTIEGLALHLDLTRFSLLNYENSIGYEEYFNTIKKAKLRIQHDKVVNGLTGKSNPAITIFDLKNNHGYVEKQEVEQKNTHEIKDIETWADKFRNPSSLKSKSE